MMTPEEIRKALAKISPPDPVTPYINTETSLRAEVDREMARGPMPVNGDDKGFRVRGQRPASWGDDPRVVEKLNEAGVLRKGERLNQFIARTGMSPRQAIEFSRDEIIDFVRVTGGHERPPAPRMQKIFFDPQFVAARGLR